MGRRLGKQEKREESACKKTIDKTLRKVCFEMNFFQATTLQL